VCELTQALQLSQPKISRHLAIVAHLPPVARPQAGGLVYYRLHRALPDWAMAVLSTAAQGLAGESLFMEDAARLTARAEACPSD
jgi:ArsR family transcriptional regulator